MLLASRSVAHLLKSPLQNFVHTSLRSAYYKIFSGNISSNASFGKVFAVAGTYKQLERVEKMVKKYPGDVIVMKDATDLYIGSNTMGLCSNAVRKGKELAFVITGKKDTDKVKYMAEKGWSSMRAVSNQLDEFLNIKNVARAARTIKSSMIKG